MSAVPWTITGEAGKALDATARSLEAMKVEGLWVSFASGRADVMRWVIPLGDDMEPMANTAPELRQKVTLWRDGSRYFSGHCLRRRPMYQGEKWAMQIEVHGALWWLDQMTLTSDQDDQAGNTEERAAFVFGSGSLSGSFSALVARAVAKGAPIAAGTIATMYSIPRLTITGKSFSAALLDLQKWVPDSMLAFDYSGATPALKITRRKTGLVAGSAATRTITLGTDNVTDLDLQPMIELQVASVRTDSASRDSQGRGIWQSALEGAPTVGQDQIVIISGPENIDTSLPPDFFDAVQVRTRPIKPNNQLTGEIFELYDQRLKASGATGLAMGPFTVSTVGGGTFTLPGISPLVEKKDGGALPAGRARFLTVGEPKDWWIRDGYGWEMARAQATLFTTVVSPVPVPNGYSPNPPDYVETLGMTQTNYLQSTPNGLRRTDVYYMTVAVTFPAVDPTWTATTTIYREEDYSFANPPAGLAANLLAAQNFVPYEGEVTIVHEEIPAGNPVGTCVNIANGPAELAAIRGMVQRAEIDIQNCTETLILGSNPRMSYEDLAGRFRRTGYDTFDYISNKGLVPQP